jgi:hypothetical protein
MSITALIQNSLTNKKDRYFVFKYHDSIIIGLKRIGIKLKTLENP